VKKTLFCAYNQGTQVFDLTNSESSDSTYS